VGEDLEEDGRGCTYWRLGELWSCIIFLGVYQNNAITFGGG